MDNELYEKYKKINPKLKFYHYYKYNFTYSNDEIKVGAGIDGDVYRSDMDVEMTFNEIDNEAGITWIEEKKEK